MLRKQALFGICLAIFVSALCAFYLQPSDFHSSDFYSFWAAAQLRGRDLYDPAKLEALQRLSSPLVSGKRFIRPPFYAFALWPLGQLPFRTAYIVWYAVNLLALAAFVQLWKDPPRTYIVCALFLPLAWSFGLGQDVPIMLALFWLGVCLVERSQFPGGVLLSLCAIKPHLFVFLPVVLIAQKRFRASLGMIAGATGLYCVSAWMLGRDWPRVLLSAAQANEAVYRPNSLSVSGLLAGLGVPGAFSWILLAAIAGAIWYGAPRWSWQSAAALAVAGGVLWAPHVLLYDAALLLPLLFLAELPIPAILIFGLVCASAVSPRFVWIAQIACLLVIWLGRPRLRWSVFDS